MSEYKIGGRHIIELDQDGDYYFKHVMAMTKEELYSKNDIAAELGWRDREIDRLRAELVISNNRAINLKRQINTNYGIYG